MFIKPLRNRLDQIAKQTSFRLDILQQDYMLSWILKGIFDHPLLKSKLIFKGGTALKKCYFGKYRFSQDLDFSIKSDVSSRVLFKAIKEICEYVQEEIKKFAVLQLRAKKYKEKNPHPNRQEAFVIYSQFPWQSQPLTTVMIEISRDEIILLKPVLKSLIHEYGESISTKIPVYSLEEIILEKLRAILQHTKKLHERDWTRSRVRDYYDLWRIMNSFQSKLDLKIIKKLLPMKCNFKGVLFDKIEHFFDIKMINYVHKTWSQWLGPLISNLPESKVVIKDLKDKIDRILFL